MIAAIAGVKKRWESGDGWEVKMNKTTTTKEKEREEEGEESLSLNE